MDVGTPSERIKRKLFYFPVVLKTSKVVISRWLFLYERRIMCLGDFQNFNLMRLLVRHLILPYKVRARDESNYTSGRIKSFSGSSKTH